MLRRALILLTLLTVHAVAQPASEPTPMAQAVAAIKLNWQRVEITEEKPPSHRLQLYYKPLGQRHSPVVSKAEATADTMEVAGAVPNELKKEGKEPAKDQINLSVWAQLDAGKGMTGKPLGPLVVMSTTTSRIDWNTARSAPAPLPL